MKRKKRRGVASEVMVVGRVRGAAETQMRSGVVPGAEAETCPVCTLPSEGWFLESGKRTWYHFGRSFPCVERFAHLPAEGALGPAEQQEGAGPTQGLAAV